MNVTEAKAVNRLISWVIASERVTSHQAKDAAVALSDRAYQQLGAGNLVSAIDSGWPYGDDLAMGAEHARLREEIDRLRDELVTAERLRDKFQAALGAAGIETCTYCGHSYGGRATGEEIERHHAEPHPGDEVAAL